MSKNKPVIVERDPWLEPYSEIIKRRYLKVCEKESELTADSASLSDFATGYLYFGLHRTERGWVFREWAPNAVAVFLIGQFNDWHEEESFRLKEGDNGIWEREFTSDALVHGQLFKLSVHWEGGQGHRLPSYIRRVVQDERTKIFNAQVWNSPKPYKWKYPAPDLGDKPLFIYEAHVGMSGEQAGISTFDAFRTDILPRVRQAGYNAIQLMAIQEHPYYGSFGYHVSNFFAVSSRFGTPEELRHLIDEAHGMGIAVIMDLVHSHAVKNELEGLGNFDGSPYQYFHAGERREHVAWDSLCFDYGKNEVVHFLLSNCKYWLDEFRFDGFRFDGVTSMLYYDHGLSRNFTHYGMYYDGGQDEDAITYLALANRLIKMVNPRAISVAEEMSGMPGLAAPLEHGGYGFDFRLAMGIPDYWIKVIKELPDEQWNVSEIYHELTSRRVEEKTVSYTESHDQALVGDKTIIFRLLDKEMYFSMGKASQNLIIDRGVALHKMIRLVTAASAGGGYLNFMGNEFGHPEWIDFPRLGNNWSYQYARRQWSLVDDPLLRYHLLGDFDRTMIRFLSESRLYEEASSRLIADNQTDQVLAFERGDYLFVFNFNPVKSFTDYGLAVGSGKFRIVLNTDNPAFGGNGLVDESLTYFARGGSKLSSAVYLLLYIPSRTGLVLQRIPTPKVY